MKHGVTGNNVVNGFGASLSVERTANVAQLAEHVETIEHHRDAISPKNAWLSGRSTPGRRCSWHRRYNHDGEHGEVGREGDVEGQIGLKGQPIVKVAGIDGGKVGAATGNVRPCAIALGSQFYLAYAIFQFQPCET